MKLPDRRMMSLLLAGLLVLAACTSGETDPTAPAPSTPVAAPTTLLALGDSYTVGQSVPVTASWPAQLADSLAAAGHPLERRDVIAVTGWTTRDLLTALRDSLAAGRAEDEPFGLVTLLIGVNNQFQGLPFETFAADLDTLLNLATALAGGDAERVLGLTIPDYSVTPVGQAFDPDRTSREIAALNRELVAQLDSRGIPWVDVAALCAAARSEPGLVARDGLHFTGEMYRRWVVEMLPRVGEALGAVPQEGESIALDRVATADAARQERLSSARAGDDPAGDLL